jgi:hypothetical protein
MSRLHEGDVDRTDCSGLLQISLLHHGSSCVTSGLANELASLLEGFDEALPCLGEFRLNGGSVMTASDIPPRKLSPAPMP